MRPSTSDSAPQPCWPWLLALGVILAGAACDELNPDFDPDSGLFCEAGERACGATPGVIRVCSPSGWTEADCFGGTECVEGTCQPESPVVRCDSQADCADTERCTVLVDPDTPATAPHLGTFCIPTPVDGGRPGGQACSGDGECQSGWCFSSICFEACTDSSHCTNPLQECAPLDVTVDGVRESARINGCVPPSD